MAKLIGRHADERVTYDAANRAVRTWFDPTPRPTLAAHFAPASAARQVLTEHAAEFRWGPDLADLRDTRVLDGAQAHSARLEQLYKGVRVDASEVVVNMFADGRITSIYNGYHYDIPGEVDPERARLNAEDAYREVSELMARVFKEAFVDRPELIVYQYRRVANHPPKGQPQPPERARLLGVANMPAGFEAAGGAPKEGQYFLAWDVRVSTQEPVTIWRVLLDAISGRLIQVIDLAQYASGTGQVFDPNPIVTSGNTTLRHTSAAATINGQRVAVTMPRLNAPVGGSLHLDGSYVTMEEFESPVVAEPANAAGTFNFNWNDAGFLNAMTYFHLDRFQDYVQSTLGLTNVANFPIAVDPQGFSNADNSHCLPQDASHPHPRLAFGGGTAPTASNPIPDANDAMVVLHEYGHAIQDDTNPGFDDPIAGTGEGFGDFLAAVYYDDKHAQPAQTRGFMMSWDSEMGAGSWPGRRYDVPWLFDGPEYTGTGDNHIAGQLWCAAMFEIYRKLGGDSGYPGVKAAARDLAIRLHLTANFHVPASNSTAQQMGQQVESADANINPWRYANHLHQKVVYDTFRRRHLATYTDKAVDVYVNDGREGGYGSLSGNDLFTEQLWLDNYWETQDIWVRTTPYANAAAQAAGTPADHVEPPVGSTAYLYVRVKNRGTSAGGSGAVTVRAFHADPGIGLVWPNDWVPMDTPSIAVPNILPGAANGVVVGPFPWTPTVVGHECVFVIAECGNDQANTQLLGPGDQVNSGDLVPFDNNIAQRNLVPTPAKDKTTRVFWVRNPFPDVRIVQLHYQSSLPKGWRWTTNLADPRAIKLGPFERRRVDLVIDQAEGEEVTQFERDHRLSVTGTVDGILIGGMTFYVAPPSAFGQPGGGHHVTGGRHHGHLRDLLALNLPWSDIEITEGEIDIHIRFRQREDK